MSSSKMDRFTSNQDQNDQRPILHVSSNIFYQRPPDPTPACIY